MQEYAIYAGGEFITTDNQLKVINPYSGENFAYTYKAGKQELDHAIEKALTLQEDLRHMPAHQRYEILRFIADSLKENLEFHAALISKESGKPMRYALGEIKRAIQTFTVAAEESKRLPKEYISIDWTPAGENREGVVKYFPLGLVAGISPFNFPMNLAVHKIAPAIAAGCPIILKPSSLTPLSTLELAKIIDQTSLPKGAVSIIPMDRESGNQLVTDERIKLLSFTGSDTVGWKMKRDAGNKKVVLELGGNAGVVVTESSDIDHAVNRCLAGGFAYSGQVCIHAQRIYVERSIFNEFSQKYIEKVRSLKIGDPLNPDTDISSMIDEKNAQRVEDWIGEAKEAGAEILAGGKRVGTDVEPTVLTNTKDTMKVCSLEVFGPVVALEPFENFENAIAEVNNSDFGLQAGVFTNRINQMNYAFDRLEVGGLIINDVPTFRVDHMPYGGVKNSGFGREGIKYSILDMMEPKIMVKSIL
ncbi:MAG: aldehyde dehydrogenase family protein [Bacteroidales bacterium]|nr:aldehyde dehydrogenase family protein [Bacteroidales bacterium]